MVKDPNRRRWSVSERFIEVIDERWVASSEV
jgi:hypothetical protein